MKRFEDERLCFFMRNRDIIREWAAIEKEIPAEAHRFLASLADDLDWIVEERVPNAVPIALLDGDWPKLFLARRAWLAENPKVARVAIGIGWQRKYINFESNLPYVGIRVKIDWEGGEELQEACGDSCGEVGRQNGYTSTSWWPCLKEVDPPNEEFWEDLVPYRKALIDSMIKAWELFSPCVDQVMNSGDR